MTGPEPVRDELEKLGYRRDRAVGPGWEQRWRREDDDGEIDWAAWRPYDEGNGIP